MATADKNEGGTRRRRSRRIVHHFPSEILMGRYEFVRYLGHGSYGHVAEALTTNKHPRLEPDTRVAIKKIPNVFDNEVDAKRLLRELRILRCLSGKEAIVQVYDVFIDGDIATFDTLLIVFEFVDTDLSKLFASDQFFGLLHIQYMLYQMCLGLKCMHSANLAHRDIKPSNILVNEDCTIKLCDFGLARCLTENNDHPTPQCSEPIRKRHLNENNLSKTNFRRSLTRHVVTRWYRAPEVILLQQSRDLLPQIDIWAIGCILSELFQMLTECIPNPLNRKPLFTGKTCFPLSCNDPWAYNDKSDQLNVIFKVLGTPSIEDVGKLSNPKARKYLNSLPKQKHVEFSEMFEGVPPCGIDLLNQLLCFDPSQRLTIDEILNHEFLQPVHDVEWDAEAEVPPQQFDFEDVPLSMQVIRELIIDEILTYNPEFLP